MQKRDKKQANKWLQFSNLAFQMLAVISASTYLGIWVDRKIGGGFWASVVFSLAGVGTAIFLVIREAIKMGEDS